MKTAKSILVVLFVLLTAQIASAYYCPSTGRWLSRDPIGEPGFRAIAKSLQLGPSHWVNRDQSDETAILKSDETKLKPLQEALMPSYLFNQNGAISKRDFLGLATTTYTWSASPCASGLKTAFIQIGLGGGTIPPTGHPFVDDGTHGLWSDSPKIGRAHV